MAMIILHAEFSLMAWSLFGLLTIGAVGLACFNEKLYSLMPWACVG